MNDGVWNNTQILNESTVELMHSPQFEDVKTKGVDEDFGLGFEIFDYEKPIEKRLHGSRIIGHSGWYIARMYFKPEEKTGVIVLTHVTTQPLSLSWQPTISDRLTITKNMMMYSKDLAELALFWRAEHA